MDEATRAERFRTAREHLEVLNQQVRENTQRIRITNFGSDFVYVPDLELAPRYAELNPTGTTEIIHIITTLEAKTP